MLRHGVSIVESCVPLHAASACETFFALAYLHMEHSVFTQSILCLHIRLFVSRIEHFVFTHQTLRMRTQNFLHSDTHSLCVRITFSMSMLGHLLSRV